MGDEEKLDVALFEQIDEALEEREGSDRRKQDTGTDNSSSGEDRRKNDRRNSPVS